MSERESAISRYLATIGRKGGQRTLAKLGAKGMSALGRKGGKARAAKYDPDTLRRWASKGGRPPKKAKG